MEAKLERFGELFVCHLSGRLDYHTVDPFKETCIKNLSNQKVIFNLSQLSFVGSVGIGPFLETMSVLSRKEFGVLKFCGVQTEFRRVFEVSDVKHVEIYEDEQRAKLAFQGYAITPVNSLFIEALNRPGFVNDVGTEDQSVSVVDQMDMSPSINIPVDAVTVESSEDYLSSSPDSEVDSFPVVPKDFEVG